MTSNALTPGPLYPSSSPGQTIVPAPRLEAGARGAPICMALALPPL
jgi:hypothetical protein